MTTYAITGGNGFLAWHLRCRLKAECPDVDVTLIGRGGLDDPPSLARALDACDVVFHLAAVNSHDPVAAAENEDIARNLVAGLDRVGVPPHVVFSNSVHAEGSSAYGEAKRSAAEVLRQWAVRSSGTVADVMLPNLFGEMSRPYYNSAVATFCHSIVNGRECTVNRAGSSELLHAQDAATALLTHAASRTSATTRISGEVVQVGDVFDRLVSFHGTYRDSHIVPRLPTSFDVRLFNQLRTTLYPTMEPMSLVRHSDHRGAFLEAVRGFECSQTAFSTTAPGITRGEHWHADKIERFLVLRGTATIEIRRLFDDAVRTFEVTGTEPAFVDMPTLHAHNITNVGDDELLTMFWANDHFCADSPDTWPEPVRRPDQVEGARR